MWWGCSDGDGVWLIFVFFCLICSVGLVVDGWMLGKCFLCCGWRVVDGKWRE